MADDFSELYQLAADLEDAPDNLPPFLAKAIGQTSKRVKDDAQKSVRSRDKRLSHAASAIDYELTGTSGAVSGISSEIGYDKGKSGGPLGTWIEYGAPNAGNHIAPSHDLGNALMNNEDDLVKGVTAAVDDAMREAGL